MTEVENYLFQVIELGRKLALELIRAWKTVQLEEEPNMRVVAQDVNDSTYLEVCGSELFFNS